MKRTEAFDFYQPATLQEASRLLKDNGPGGRFLAGGTDLVIAMKEKGLLPKYIVDLKRVPGLAGIRENSDGSITLGALTTLYTIETSALIKKKLSVPSAKRGGSRLDPDSQPRHHRRQHGQRLAVGRYFTGADGARRQRDHRQWRRRKNRCRRRLLHRSGPERDERR